METLAFDRIKDCPTIVETITGINRLLKQLGEGRHYTFAFLPHEGDEAIRLHLDGGETNLCDVPDPAQAREIAKEKVGGALESRAKAADGEAFPIAPAVIQALLELFTALEDRSGHSQRRTYSVLVIPHNGRKAIHGLVIGDYPVHQPISPIDTAKAEEILERSLGDRERSPL